MQDKIYILIAAGAIMFAVIGGLSLLAHYYTLNGIKSRTVGDGQHGTARFATKKEIERTYKRIPFRPKAWRKNKTAVYAIAPYASRGLTKLGGALIQAAPGTETEVLHALRERRAELEAPAAAIVEGTIFLVGERLGAVPGALSAVAMLAKTNGGRIAWIPRRAGERGALEAGCLPDLLPGGRPARDPQARAELQGLWDAEHLPAPGGRDGHDIVRAAGMVQDAAGRAGGRLGPHALGASAGARR